MIPYINSGRHGHSVRAMKGQAMAKSYKETTANISRQMSKLRADIPDTMGGFSAHADQNGLLDWYGAMAPSRPRTIITHGEDRARRAFSEQIKQRFGAQTECPALDDVIEI